MRLNDLGHKYVKHEKESYYEGRELIHMGATGTSFATAMSGMHHTVFIATSKDLCVHATAISRANEVLSVTILCPNIVTVLACIVIMDSIYCITYICSTHLRSLNNFSKNKNKRIGHTTSYTL